MKSEISFKALNRGLGLYNSEIRNSSYYENKDEARLSSSYSQDVFFNLDLSGDNYDQLLNRLEQPVLDSLEGHASFQTPLRKKITSPMAVPIIKQQAQRSLKEDQALGLRQLPPLGVLFIDYSFSIGLFLLSIPVLSYLFNFIAPPSIFLSIIAYNIFHQIYVTLCRSFSGCTLGEQRYNLGWSYSSVPRFFIRSLLIMCTGFISIPILSAIFKKDLFEICTGLKLRYNI